MSRGEGAIRGKFGAISRGFNIRWATRLLRETPRADLFSVRAQRSSVGLLGQRQFFSPRKRRWAGARGRKTAAGRTAVRPYIPLPLCGKGGTRNRANRRAPLHPAATLWERGNAQSGEPPCAPTSRCHSVGKGERAIGRTAVRPYIPLPLCGRGGTRDRANRRSPLHPAATGGRGAGGEGYTKCASSARSELNRCTLVIPIAEPKFTKDSS
jgi:hypothetical protein